MKVHYLFKPDYGDYSERQQQRQTVDRLIEVDKLRAKGLLAPLGFTAGDITAGDGTAGDSQEDTTWVHGAAATMVFTDDQQGGIRPIQRRWSN